MYQCLLENSNYLYMCYLQDQLVSGILGTLLLKETESAFRLENSYIDRYWDNYIIRLWAPYGSIYTWANKHVWIKNVHLYMIPTYLSYYIHKLTQSWQWRSQSYTYIIWSCKQLNSSTLKTYLVAWLEGRFAFLVEASLTVWVGKTRLKDFWT